ncbi:MAG TPA: hypothetical protein VLV31_12510 [Candidatus Acidoferrales bacterium]|nr:hypothetical protein [Candidatus Acidoferrales bacterium]
MDTSSEDSNANDENFNAFQTLEFVVKSMQLPETVLTKGKGGKLEVRTLDSRGSYILCKYLDPKTMKPADRKRKLTLKGSDGRVLEYFIIPLKDAKRSLLITSDPEEKERQVWNEETQKAEVL